MSLLFNKLSRLVITFLSRSKHLVISWLQSPSAVILEPKKQSLSLFPLFLPLFAMKSAMPWTRQWHPTPVLLPGKSLGLRSLAGCSPWGHCESDTTEQLHFHFSFSTFMHWRRKWQPTPVFLPGESQGRGSLVACLLWGRTELDTTEATKQQQQQ